MPIDDESPERKEERLALEELCAAIGRRIGAVLPNGVGFCLMLFDFGADGNFAYISSAERESMVEMLHEAIGKLGGDQ